jgi:hypothetical protein
MLLITIMGPVICYLIMLAFIGFIKTLQVCPVTGKVWAYESAMIYTVRHPIIPLPHPPTAAHPQIVATKYIYSILSILCSCPNA